MSGITDFVIENGVLKKYIGNDGDIVIPQEVTSIGEYAFSWCQILTSVTICHSVTSIGNGAFFSCVNLTTVKISHSVTTFGEHIFEGCKKLTSVEFPENLKIIPNSTFARCESLVTFTFPHSVTEIGYSAFVGCTGLTSITIPHNVKRIYDCAFSYCSNLTSLSISDSIETIGDEAFKYTNLKELVLLKTSTDFNNSALEIIFKHFFTTEHKFTLLLSFLRQMPLSVLYNENISKKIKANKNKIINYSFDQEDTEIIEKLFDLHKTIELDELDKYIKKAKDSASVKAFLINYKDKKYSAEEQEKIESIKFEKDLGLKKRTVADWKKIYNFVTTDGTAKITGYKGTDTDIIIPESIGKNKIVAIGKYAFSPRAPRLNDEQREIRRNITNVVIPEGLTNISERAFYSCISLSSIIIPDSVKSIGNESFSMCRKLTIHAPEGSLAAQIIIR